MTTERVAQQAHHTLSLAEVCDLGLVAGGVLPSGTLLGEPLTMLRPPSPVAPLGSGSGTGTQVGVALPQALYRRLPPDGVVREVTLYDEEQTPLAVLHDAQAVGETASRIVRGRLELRRPRESGVLAGVRLDLTAAVGVAHDLLVLARPPVDADTQHLRRWRAGTVGRPLVVVGEGAEHGYLPTPVVGYRVASWLARHMDLAEAEIRVAPLRGRDPRTDHYLATLLAEHLQANNVLVLSPESPAEGAAAWSAAATYLREGHRGTPPGVDPGLSTLLRRWLPTRGDRGLVVLLTGLSGSGKSTLARDLDRYLALHTDRRTSLLDGDVVRRLLSSGLGFDLASRETNVRRIGWVAARIAEHGGTAICAPIAPFDRTRQEVRAMAQAVGDFVLVHVSTPLDECERRDLKGLYARARAGEVADFTGISSPYEVPQDADLVVDTSRVSRAEALDRLWALLTDRGYLADVAATRPAPPTRPPT